MTSRTCMLRDTLSHMKSRMLCHTLNHMTSRMLRNALSHVTSRMLCYTLSHMAPCLFCYEGCSNMDASSFITFVTYMLRQNSIRLYKGLYVTFKLAPDLKQKTVYLSSYPPLNESHFSILTNAMLRTYQ